MRAGVFGSYWSRFNAYNSSLFFTAAGGLLYLTLSSVVDQSKNLRNQQEATRYFQAAAIPMLSHSSNSKVPRPSSPPLNPKTN